MCLIEPLQIVALFVAGGGHWLSSTAMIVGAYAVSLLIIERLFRAVKPKLMTLRWCQSMDLGRYGGQPHVETHQTSQEAEGNMG